MKRIPCVKTGATLAVSEAIVCGIVPRPAIRAGEAALLGWLGGPPTKWLRLGFVLISAAAAFARRRTSARSTHFGFGGRTSRRRALSITLCAVGGIVAVIVAAADAEEKSGAPPQSGAADICSPAGTQNMTSNQTKIKEMDVYCRLQPPELRARGKTLLAELSARICETAPLENGYSLKLIPDDASIRFVADLIVAERKCCPFLQFQLTAAQDSQALYLELRGPAGSREIIANLLRLPIPAVGASHPVSNP
jgi:hypothetical protein